MNKFDDKSNNELFLIKKEIEAEYESVKIKVLNGWDKLLELEKEFAALNNVINQRLKVNDRGH
jgi:hypothetical protein